MNDSRRSGSDGPGDFEADLVPSEDFVAGDVKRLAECRGIANQAGEAHGKVAGGGEGPRIFALVGDKNRFAVFEPSGEGIRRT